MVKRFVLLLVFALVATTLASAIPKTGEGDDENKHKTSQDRTKEKELSEQLHFEKHEDDDEDEDHNKEFDHEAFLGKEEAKSFDQLTPAESQQRLGFIYDKIDKDKDGVVTEEELQNWIKYVQNKYIWTDTERQWDEHEAEGDKIHWDSYKKRTYGFMEDQQDGEEEEDGYSYKDMIRRDERRWKKADQDNDGQLSKEEFADFLHPEDKEHMRDIVIDETLEDIDKDKDGFISLEEYIADLWDDDDDDEDEPEWLKDEREEFHSERDKNADGKLDRDEIATWIIPDDDNYVKEETSHLIKEADVNKDGKLSKEEVLNKYDLFVGSQATDFGEALTRHDEF